MLLIAPSWRGVRLIDAIAGRQARDDGITELFGVYQVMGAESGQI